MSLQEGEDLALRGLVERAKGREADAEGELHRRYRGFVQRRLEEARRRRNWFWLNDLEGAVQDVLTQFFRALREGKFVYVGPRALEGFLVRTAFFVAMNLKDKAPGRTVSIHADTRSGEDGGLRFDLADFSEAVYDQLERQECLRLLAQAVAALNPNRRDVVERTLLGQKVRQICAQTGRSPGSVSGLKFNALVELRKRLAALGFVEKCGEVFNLGGGEDDGSS